jgi:flagellar basal-body rod modification protein FlgD
MTTVAPVSSAQPQEPAVAARNSAGDLDYNAFLKLLIAQLKNQDPSEPVDSTAFVAQLATFSQLEQSITSNGKLDAILAAADLDIANSIIGRTLTSPDGSASGIVASVKLTASGPVATLDDGTTITIGSGVVVS